jgi:hypothetical protein
MIAVSTTTPSIRFAFALFGYFGSTFLIKIGFDIPGKIRVGEVEVANDFWLVLSHTAKTGTQSRL